jgi:hypothetical protein
MFQNDNQHTTKNDLKNTLTIESFDKIEEPEINT